MADTTMYSIRVKEGVKKWGTDWKNSLEFLGCPTAMYHLAKGYRYYINKFVPKRTGDLRRSARPKGWAQSGTGSARIYWGSTQATAKYTHYQFVGDVYGPNKALFAQGPNPDGSVGALQWSSPKGKKKTNQNRKMGKPFSYTLSNGQIVNIKGYTTKGTTYNWIQAFKDDAGDYGEAAINVRAGRYMYELFCIKSHSTGHPVNAVGGYRIYHSWRQIEKIRD